jgi:hypothetical protein
MTFSRLAFQSAGVILILIKLIFEKKKILIKLVRVYHFYNILLNAMVIFSISGEKEIPEAIYGESSVSPFIIISSS